MSPQSQKKFPEKFYKNPNYIISLYCQIKTIYYENFLLQLELVVHFNDINYFYWNVYCKYYYSGWFSFLDTLFIYWNEI